MLMAHGHSCNTSKIQTKLPNEVNTQLACTEYWPPVRQTWELEDVQQPQCKAQLRHDSLWFPKAYQHFLVFPHGSLIQGLRGANPIVKKKMYAIQYAAQVRQI